MIEGLTPRQVVEELDKYIVGQEKAKRAVAVALRNRLRRQQISEDLRDEVIPKNILMIGPTGVGKTEIARRLAALAEAPFVKVEATKFTEVGYVGRDVEGIIRDLADIGYRMVEDEAMDDVWEEAEKRAQERLLDYMSGAKKPAPANPSMPTVLANIFGNQPAAEAPPVPSPEQAAADYQRIEEERRQAEHVREFTLKRLKDGELEEQEVEIEVEEQAISNMQVFSPAGFEEMGFNMSDMLGNIFPPKKVTKNTTVAEARRLLTYQEAERLVDPSDVAREAMARVEDSGIVFLDELDKVAGRESGHGPDVSREGVQRDILPIVEGSTVMTKYGPVDTSHILFIAAGAFHVSKPSDLIPELQGRFPLRVELTSLGEADFARILVEPQNSLVKQYTALLETEGVKLIFADEAIQELARLAQHVNDTSENIGARRLYTLMERLLEDLSFHAPDLGEQTVQVDLAYVRTQLKDVVENRDLSRYML